MQATISPEVYEFLKRHARKFETLDGVLRRKLAGFGKSGRKRLRKGLATPESEFRSVAVKALKSKNGEVEWTTVLKLAEKIARLNRYDREKVASGQVRWHKRLAFAMMGMKNEGLLEQPRRGWWKLASTDVPRGGDFP